jgi:fermentation-respiration switch protein FrsA (DUF1100 family)
VVICHGFKGFKDWGFFPSLATAVARRGHAAISFDFSRNGVGRDREFSELDRFAEHTHSRNVDEIRMVLDAVTGGVLFPRRPARIGLFGHSRGGGEAVLAAAGDGRVDALVTWAAISAVGRASDVDIAAWERGETVYVENKRTGQRLPVAPTFWSDIISNRQRLDILGAASRVQIPWLIAHGSADETVSPASARSLFDAAGPRAELLLVEGATHTFGAQHPYTGATPELRTVADATLGWFDRHLAAQPPAERAGEPVL